MGAQAGAGVVGWGEGQSHRPKGSVGKRPTPPHPRRRPLPPSSRLTEWSKHPPPVEPPNAQLHALLLEDNLIDAAAAVPSHAEAQTTGNWDQAEAL